MKDILYSPRDRTIQIVLGFGILTALLILGMAVLRPGRAHGLFRDPIMAGFFLGWWLVWPTYLLLAHPPTPRWFTGPRKAFLITLPVIIVLHLICVRLGDLWSLASIEGDIRATLGVIYAPYYMVVGPWAPEPASWGLGAFAALTWANIISWTAMLIVARRSSDEPTR